MSRSTYTMFIGVFSAALNFIMFIYTFMILVGFSLFVSEAEEETSKEKDSSDEVTAETAIGVSMIFLILMAEFIFSFVISMLMVVGVKKENHRYIAPWVYLTLFGLLFQTFVIYKSFEHDEDDDDHSHGHVFAIVLVTVIMSALWYPVYKYYKTLKNCKSVAVEVCAPTTPAVASVTPAYVYNTPDDFCHANAKYVPVAAPQQSHVVYPSVSEC